MLAKTDVIDFIADDDQRVVLCLVVEAEKWALPDAPRLLQEKVYRYADYVSEGVMLKQHPDTAGKEYSSASSR